MYKVLSSLELFSSIGSLDCVQDVELKSIALNVTLLLEIHCYYCIQYYIEVVDEL
jgi:hypothetical protein